MANKLIKPIKKALAAKYGYKNVNVKNGRGTAWGWVEAKIKVKKPEQCHCGENNLIGYCDYCKRDKENYEKKMLAEGWIKLTEEVIRQADKDKKKLLVNATGQNDWATIKIENIFKPLILVDNIMLQKPRMRTRGYYLSQFENAFCKIIN